jgi:hypothetical protein
MWLSEPALSLVPVELFPSLTAVQLGRYPVSKGSPRSASTVDRYLNRCSQSSNNCTGQPVRDSQTSQNNIEYKITKACITHVWVFIKHSTAVLHVCLYGCSHSIVPLCPQVRRATTRSSSTTGSRECSSTTTMFPLWSKSVGVGVLSV